MNLVQILARQVHERPDAPAIITTHRGRDRSITFAELENASASAAQLLHNAGLQIGNRVLVFQPMSIELYVALLAIFRSGLTAMFLDPSAGRDHIERCCQIGQPRALIASSKAHLLRFISPPLRKIPLSFSIGCRVPWTLPFDFNVTGESPNMQPFEPVASDTPALLTFTSGSTGIPKAAVRSHRFLLAQHRVLETSIDLQAGEIDMATLPVFVLANLGSGVTSLLPDADLRRPGQIDPDPVARQIARHRPTRSAASPAFFERLLDHYEAHPADAYDIPLRKIYTGGAAVFPSLLQRIKKTFPASRPVAVYGSTEAEPIAHLGLDEISPDDLASMNTGAGILTGRPVPEIQVRLSLDHEIQVAGDHVLSGYLNGEGDAETKIHEGGKIWHRTGDAGRFDAQGRMWLLGRCSARMSNGLHPFTVECVAAGFDWVRRSGCVEVEGKRVLAVEPRNGFTPDLTRLGDALAWAGLDRIILMKRLPVDARHNAKIDYASLRVACTRKNGSYKSPEPLNPD